MKGMIVFYINYHPENENTPDDYLKTVKELNADLFKKISDEGVFEIALIPVSNESCRVEKLYFETGIVDSSEVK